MKVSAATPDDARAVAEVQVLSWQGAYQALLPTEFLAMLSIEKREVMWREQLVRGAPELLVARLQGKVCGFVSFGASRDAGAGTATAEVMAIYLAPHCWSSGVGRALWLAARDRMEQQGFTDVTLWVLAGNARALRFYQMAGFVVEPGSRKPLTLGGNDVDEVRCVRSLRVLSP